MTKRSDRSGSDLIVSLAVAGLAGPAMVGGKAAALGALLDAGFPVPSGICLTTAAFDLALASYREGIDTIYRQHDLADPAAAVTAAAAIADLLAPLSLPAGVEAALAEALPALAEPATPLAVRSSAVGEDGPETSFAGQYESVLGVSGREPVVEAILTCWRAFFSARALAARAALGEPAGREGLALLLQPLLAAGCAGVAFSLDPVAHVRDVVVVNAAWGLGSGVAEGSVAADTYRLALRAGRLRLQTRTVVSQAQQWVAGRSEKLERVSVPQEQQQQPVLPEAWAVRVAQLALTAAAHRGRPQEIEWAVADGRLWLLQSRPLTGLPPALAAPSPFPVTWEREQESCSLWAFTNFTGESGQLRPLEHDYVEWRNFTTWESRRWGGLPHIRQVRIFNGYPYMGRLPSGLRPGDQEARRVAIEALMTRLAREERTAWEHWGPEVIATAERIMALDLDTADAGELADHLETTLGGFRYNWMRHPMLWFVNQSARLEETYTSISGQPAAKARALLADLVQGEEHALTRLLDAIYELAQEAGRVPVVAALVRQGDETAIARLPTLPEAAPFWRAFQAFLGRYGNRCGYSYGSETMFQAPTWHDRPDLLLQLLVPYLDPEIEAPAALRAHRQQMRDEQVNALCAAADDPQAVAAFRRELAYARRRAILLEEHNHYIDQLTEGQMRRAILVAGRRLAALGAIAETEDVYWLRFEEILEALRAPLPPRFEAVIRNRKETFAAREALLPPPFLGVPAADLPPRPPPEAVLAEGEPDEIPGQLVGQPASAGRYRGRARIVPATVLVPELAPGDVLVAENVGALWIPLFPILGALVLDGGALGQHAAAAAREYGLPAVIQTGTATERIPEGAWMTVDGTAGTIIWEVG